MQRRVLRQCGPRGTLSDADPCESKEDVLTGRRQIDLQLAKQGFRLAAWLNVLFDGATNLP